MRNLYKKSPALLRKIGARIYERVCSARERLGEKYTQIAKEKIKEIAKDNKPFFLFIHYWDVHIPYNPPKKLLKIFMREDYGELPELDRIMWEIDGEWKNRLKKFTRGIRKTAEMLARYDACIRYVDEQVGQIIDILEKKNIFEETIIIITSDHGESLIEHGIYFDHHGLYDESIHVPLIIIYPKIFCPQKINGFIQHVDVVPTLLDLLDIEDKKYNIDGKSFIPLVKEKKEIRKFIFAEEAYTQRKKCIRTEKYKYIYSNSLEDAICRYCGKIHGGIEELYYLETDPAEIQNIAEEEPQIVNELKRQLFEFIKNMQSKKTENEKARISEKIKELKRLDKL